MVIDDNPGFRETVRQLLERMEDVEFAGGASGAVIGIELIERLHPEIVLLDMVMPDMNGLEAARRIVRRHGLPRVVIMSSYRGAELERAARAAGADAFVYKPDAGSALERLVLAWFGRKIM